MFAVLLQPFLAALISAAPPHEAPRDSVRVLRAARSAQAHFEYIRRRHLPWTWSTGGSECDEYVGRFCLWHSDDAEADDWVAPSEPSPIREERDRLLRALDTAAIRLPGDSWIVGQRVRYLVEAERHADAVEAAQRCRAQRWWCLALQGFAHHTAAAFAPADSAFAAALAAMPEGDRRQWTDLTLLLDPRETGRYRRATRPARDSLEQRFWWLADPLFIVPGNERRSEHFARHVVDRLQERSHSAEAISWGADLRELLLRYGWPIGWERIRPDYPRVPSGPASILTHYAARSWHFVPRLAWAEDPSLVEPGGWRVDESRARTEYAPAYASRFGTLEHQVAAFRRGDSAVVVAAYHLTAGDSLPPDARVRAALFLAASATALPAAVGRESNGLEGTFSLAVPTGPVLFSLETVAAEQRYVGRARYTLRLPSAVPGLALSDLLLVRPDTLPQSLEDAVSRARGSAQVRPGERLGLFWEVYGLTPSTARALGVTVALERINVGTLRRVAERLGLATAAAPLQLEWREEATMGTILPRSLTVGLPDLPPGEYRLTVAVQPEGGAAATAARVLRVAP